MKRYQFKGAAGEYVYAVNFDRVTAERDALQQRLNAADQRIDDRDGSCEWSQEDDTGIWNSGCGVTTRRLGATRLPQM
ncbi:hypothetical protein [Pseudomonas sp. A-RE-19]|uniref:hypothetical protein n=1 Tax=Pseudomonas sp. A-RE-19 TaxID=2832401 RepID=UPI001CBD3B14|nr:hypothetical protein [Pseudomonas sp. A-RE-19]